MPTPAAERAPKRFSERNRNSGTMAQFALPITEVLVVADGWQSEPDAEAVIQRAVAAALFADGVTTLLNPCFAEDGKSALRIARRPGP